MLHIAHRGCIDNENTIIGIQKAFDVFSCVEVDVRYNTKRDVILCHDREKRNEESNELFSKLCALPTPMHLFVDIKAFGIETARKIATDIVKIVTNYPQHRYELCSFNENCVQQLIELRICSRGYVFPYEYTVGVITSGIPVGMFGHLHDIDFISFNYDIVHEEIIDKIKHRNIKLYAWVCNDNTIKRLMDESYHLDGIIYDYDSTLNDYNNMDL